MKTLLVRTTTKTREKEHKKELLRVVFGRDGVDGVLNSILLVFSFLGKNASFLCGELNVQSFDVRLCISSTVDDDDESDDDDDDEYIAALTALLRLSREEEERRDVCGGGLLLRVQRIIRITVTNHHS